MVKAARQKFRERWDRSMLRLEGSKGDSSPESDLCSVYHDVLASVRVAAADSESVACSVLPSYWQDWIAGGPGKDANG